MQKIVPLMSKRFKNLLFFLVNLHCCDCLCTWWQEAKIINRPSCVAWFLSNQAVISWASLTFQRLWIHTAFWLPIISLEKKRQNINNQRCTKLMSPWGRYGTQICLLVKIFWPDLIMSFWILWIGVKSEYFMWLF